MGSRFLSSGLVSGLDDGTGEINIYSAQLQSLTPNLPVRATADKTLTSALLSLSDTSGLSTALTEKQVLDFINNVASPDPPAAGRITVFSKNDKLFQLDSNGVETELSGGGGVQSAWQFSILTSGAPAVGVLAFNNATPTSTTEMRIHTTNAKGHDMRPLLQTLTLGDSIFICDANKTNCKLFQILDNTDNTTYFSLLVQYESQSAVANFTDGELLSTVFYITSNPFNQSLNTSDAVSFTDLTLTNTGLTIQPPVGDSAELKLNGGAVVLRNNTVGGSLTMINNVNELTIGGETITASGTQSLSLLNTSPTNPTDINMTKLFANSGTIASGEILSNVQTLARGIASTPVVGRIRSTATENFAAGANGAEMTIATVKNGETTPSVCATFSEGGVKTDVLRVGNFGSITSPSTNVLKIHENTFNGEVQIDAGGSVLTLNSNGTMAYTTNGLNQINYSGATMSLQTGVATQGFRSDNHQTIAGRNLISQIDTSNIRLGDVLTTGAIQPAAAGITDLGASGAEFGSAYFTGQVFGASAPTASNSLTSKGYVDTANSVISSAVSDLQTKTQNISLATTSPNTTDLNGFLRINNEPIGYVYLDDRSDVQVGCTLAGQNAGNRGVATGSGLTAFGENALSSATTCFNNVAVGGAALEDCKTAVGVTAVGALALNNLVSGNNNTAVGFLAGGTLETGTDNILIGSVADVTDPNAVGRISIGTTCASDTDRHCVIESECIKPLVAGCDLGTATKNYDVAHINSINTNTLTSVDEIAGATVIVDEDYTTGTTGGTEFGDVVPGITPDGLQLSIDIANQGGGIFWSGALPATVTIEFDWLFKNPGGGAIEDGNAIAFFTSDLTTFNSAFKWYGNPNGVNYGYTTVSNEFQIRSGEIPFVNVSTPVFVSDTTYSAKLVITPGNVDAYNDGVLLLSQSVPNPLAARASYGITAHGSTTTSCNYFIKNLKIYTPGAAAGFNMRMPTIATPYYSMGLAAAETVKLDGDQMRINGDLVVTGSITALTQTLRVGSGDVSINGNTTMSGTLNTLTPIGGKYSQTGGDVIVQNTTAVTSLINSGAGTLDFVANEFIPGACYHLKFGGTIQDDSRNEEIDFVVSLSGATIFTTTFIDLENITGDFSYELEVDIVCRTDGVSGVFQTNGQFLYNRNGAANSLRGLGISNTATINTTEAKTLELTAQWSSDETANILNTTMVVLTKTF